MYCSCKSASVSAMKFRPAWTIAASVLVVTASLFSIRYLDRLPSERLAALLGITVTVRDINQTPIPSSQVIPAQGNESAILGLVTIQTYSGSALIRQGT